MDLMKNEKINFFIVGIVVILLIITAIYVLWQSFYRDNAPKNEQPNIVKENNDNLPVEKVKVMVENLSIPWDIAFLPDRTLLVTERAGRLLHMDLVSREKTTLQVQGVEHRGEGGLLGIVLHPKFKDNHWLYLYLTSRSGNKLVNRVERYRWNDNNQLAEKTVILENIPGADYHDGGRMAFGPDGYLYITVGDAGNAQLAQNTQSLSGKILRVRDDGAILEDNPFGNAVYSYGHRNPQGITWDNQNRLWSTEHGRSGFSSGLDEINLIFPGENYGWPDSEGNKVLPNTKGPIRHSGPNVTWAPASALYWDGSIFFGGLRGQTLYEAVISGEGVTEVREHYKGEFGRIRTVRLGPDGMFYITTSNRDALGNARFGSDKIIRINPSQFRDKK